MKRRSDASLADELAELRATIERLEQVVRTLTSAVDELADEVGWRNNQFRAGGDLPPPLVLKSMPLDPTANDWKINAVDQVADPADSSSARRPAGDTLF